MAVDKFYVIKDNTVQNIALFKEEDAARMGLKRYPIISNGQTVDINWTYLPAHDMWAAPPLNLNYELHIVRRTRNALLAESDLYTMPDRWSAYTQDEQQAWKVYRQALRDIPQTLTDPTQVVWPQKPWVEAMESIKPSTPEV
jgi:hypothetical protein